MEHPAFTEAGSNPGVEIWTIEKFEPVAVDTKLHGKFYNADSYIVLKTTGEDNSTYSYDAHFWLGTNTTQDKKGSAAILTITLDDMLGGKAVHHREVQGHESSLFLGYFKPAIRYLEGGTESGFNEVVTNAGAEKRLLKLSGSDNMRIEEVSAEASSLTKDHCFILEVEHDIFVLMPEGAKATQRRKIISVANTLRDDYHNGRATIEIIDEFSSDDDYALFFDALGSGSKDDLVDDQGSEIYTRDGTSVFLYKVIAGDDIEVVALSKPFKQKHLASDEVYILDTPLSGIFIWLGKDVESTTKSNYFDIAQKYLDIKGYPAWVNITRVSEGAENSTFKQYFHYWDSVSSKSSDVKGLVSEIDAGYFSADADESAATAKLIGKSASARGYMPDHGEGNLTVTRVSGDSEDVTEDFSSGLYKFYQSEIYIVQYRYNKDNGDDAVVLYWWIGADASAEDKWTAYELISQLDEELEGSITATVKVPQGKEPKHLLTIFKGKLCIFFGKRDDVPDEDKIRLFRVEGTETGVDMRMVEVEANANVLEDDDVFILDAPQIVYVRNGKESHPKEREAAVEFISSLGVSEDKEICVVEQEDEPEAFWEALGGTPEEKEDSSGWRSALNRRVTTPRTLTAATYSVTGKIKFEELPEYSQQDLSDDGVYILDTGEELYYWQGKNTPERVKKATSDIVREFIKDDGLDRTVDSAIVVSVKQGQEPSVFKKLFSNWDEDMWDNQESYEDIKNQTKAGNA